MEVVLPECWEPGEDWSAGRGACRRAGTIPGQSLPWVTGAAREGMSANVGRRGKSATSEAGEG